MNIALQEASISQDNGDSGSEALITYMRSHCNPVVELFSSGMLNELTGSPDKARHTSDMLNYFSVIGSRTEPVMHQVPAVT